MKPLTLGSHTRLKEEIRFFGQWLREPVATGSVFPTGKALARAMAAYVPLGSDLPVLELGPGTGSVTAAMLESGIAPERIVSIEYNREFIDYLRPRFPGVTFIHGDAFDLGEALRGRTERPYCAALSGLPLLNFPKQRRSAFVEGCLSKLEPAAPLVQFTYGPLPPTPADPGHYSVSPTSWIVKNMPPARLFVYRAEASR